MKIFVDIPLADFKFWSGGQDHAKELTFEQLDEVESILEDIYPDGIDEMDLNAIFWYDFDTIKEWLGMYDDDDE